MSQQKAKTIKNSPQPGFQKKPKAEKIDPLRASVLAVRNDPRLSKAEPVIITISSEGLSPLELVAHHPIGCTTLDADEWVLSTKEELNQLLSNEKDPRADEKKLARQEFVEMALVRAGILTSVNGVTCLRGVPLVALRRLHDSDPHFGAVRAAIREAFDSSEASQAGRIFDNANRYETMKGIALDEPQVSEKALKGLDRKAVAVALYKRLLQVPQDPPPAVIQRPAAIPSVDAAQLSAAFGTPAQQEAVKAVAQAFGNDLVVNNNANAGPPLETKTPRKKGEDKSTKGNKSSGKGG